MSHRASFSTRLGSHISSRAIALVSQLVLGAYWLILFFTWKVIPLEYPATQMLFKMVMGAGGVFIMLGAIISYISRETRNVSLQYLELLIVLALIYVGGDKAYEIATADPTKSIVFGVAIVVSLYLFKPVSHKYRYVTDILAKTTNKPKGVDAQLIKSTAHHEAGHVLFYGLLPIIPQKLKIGVNDEGTPEILGYVTRVLPKLVAPRKEFLEWRMLTLLAGQQAELIGGGGLFVGSADDLKHWQRLAKLYLISGFGPLYYINPETEAESYQNYVALTELLGHHTKLVRAFLVVNKGLLKIIAETLSVTKTLTKPELELMFKSILKTDGLPNILVDDLA